LRRDIAFNQCSVQLCSEAKQLHTNISIHPLYTSLKLFFHRIFRMYKIPLEEFSQTAA